MSDNSIAPEKPIYALATDPIYIGTGGYTIGRVDNTIVRDPTTNIPKIPGSSLAGTWRYYVALEAMNTIREKLKAKLDEIIDSLNIDGTQKNKLKSNKNEINTSGFNKILNSIYKILKLQNDKKIFESLREYFKKNNPIGESNDWKSFGGNRFLQLTCAGQDNLPQESLENAPFATKEGKTGHCGHCIVCKAFGYSKKDQSWQGMLFFSDLDILFFPVYTRLGVKWISSQGILKEAGLMNSKVSQNEEIMFTQEKIEDEKRDGYINLGWLNLPYEVKNLNIDLREIKTDDFKLKPEDIIIVPDSLISQIINSNLEVRTSVSIDPITGAAKEGALFTSEAIPRGTIFYGSIRLFDKQKLGEENLPTSDQIWAALDDTKKYYKTLGIGGMTTRGFGRMKILTNLKPKINGNNVAVNSSAGGNGNEQP